jgi:zinc protease
MRSRSLLAVAAAPSAALLLAGCAPSFAFSRAAIEGSRAPLEPVRYWGRFATLPSGLRVVVYQFAGEEDVSVRMTFRAGDVDDPPGKEGLAVVAGALTERALPGRGGASLLERRYAAGALTSQEFFLDETTFTARVKPAFLAEVVGSESDRLDDPAAGLTEADVANVREEVASGLEGEEWTPASQRALVAALALSGTPYGRPAPTPESVRSITLADVRAFLRASYTAPRAVLVVSGGRDPAETMRAVVDRLGPAARGVDSAPVAPVPAMPAQRPAPPAGKLTRLPLRASAPVLWLAWPVPGAVEGLEPSAEAAALQLRTALGRRAAQPDLDAAVRWIDVRVSVVEGAAVILAAAELSAAVLAGRVRTALVEEAGRLAKRRELLDARWMVGSLQVSRYLEEGGRVPLEEVARTVRATNQPDPVTHFDEAARAQLGRGLQSYAATWLTAERTVAVLVEPRPDDPVAALPDEPTTARPGHARAGEVDWLPATSLLSAAAPGPRAVPRLVSPPGLERARRETLPNGLRLVVLPREGEPFVWVSLVLPGGGVRPADRHRAQEALKALERALPLVGCQQPTAIAAADAAIVSVAAPPGSLWYAAEAVSCWTLDLAGSVADHATTERDAAALRAMETAFLAADPPPVDGAPGWAARWVRRTFTPEGATLLVTGSVASDEPTLSRLREVFGAWAPPAGPTVERTAIPSPSRRRAVVLDVPKARQAWALVSLRRPELSGAAVATEDVLVAHLQRRLELQLAGGRVETVVSRAGGTDWASWLVRLRGEPDHVGPAVGLVLDELAREARAPVPEAEVGPARWDAAREAAFAYGGASGALSGLLRVEMRGDPPDGLERLATQLAAVDGAALQAAVAESAVGREGILLGGDAAVLEPALRALGLEPEVIRAPTNPAKKG